MPKRWVSGPLGLDNIGHQPPTNPGRIPFIGVDVLRARRRTVARTAAAQFSADMEVITCAHVHVQELKVLTSCPCTRSAIKHVDLCEVKKGLP